jgi:hypothetical protein
LIGEVRRNAGRNIHGKLPEEVVGFILGVLAL